MVPGWGGLRRALAACDDIRVLATSREPLAVAGETRYRLGPLVLPDPDAADVTGFEAVALFADRARRAEINGNGRTTIASGLNFPTGMTLGPDGNLYVSVNGLGGRPGADQVLRIAVNGGAGAR